MPSHKLKFRSNPRVDCSTQVLYWLCLHNNLGCARFILIYLMMFGPLFLTEDGPRLGRNVP